MNGVIVMAGVKNIYIVLTTVKGATKWFNGN
jgi:hypothetical protein